MTNSLLSVACSSSSAPAIRGPTRTTPARARPSSPATEWFVVDAGRGATMRIAATELRVRRAARRLPHASSFRSHRRPARSLQHVVAVRPEDEAAGAVRPARHARLANAMLEFFARRHPHPPRPDGEASRRRRDDHRRTSCARAWSTTTASCGDRVRRRSPPGRSGVRLPLRLRRQVDRRLRRHAAERQPDQVRARRRRPRDARRTCRSISSTRSTRPRSRRR